MLLVYIYTLYVRGSISDDRWRRPFREVRKLGQQLRGLHLDRPCARLEPLVLGAGGRHHIHVGLAVGGRDPPAARLGEGEDREATGAPGHVPASKGASS